MKLHAANGYLIDEFLQSKTNHQTDRYEGSLENRFRFLEEILESLQAVLPRGIADTPGKPRKRPFRAGRLI
jgi:N-ethylmaleimide reductase